MKLKRFAFAFVLLCLALVFIVPGMAEAATSEYYIYDVFNGEATIIDCYASISGDITIPSTLGGCPVTSIGDFAFSGCTGLESIAIPDGVVSIGDFAFYNCSMLKSVTIPGSVTSIGSGAFQNCWLWSLTIPDGVTSIGSYAFSGCSGLILDSVTIPDSVTSIGSGAFQGCGLYAVTMSDSLTSFGSNVFDGCRLQYNECDSGAYLGSSQNPYMILMDTIGTDITSFSFYDETRFIGSGAFENCKHLASLVIPDSITSIGNSAFSGCSSLTSITIPNSITSIGSSVFSGCSSLRWVTIPDGVTSIGDCAFSGCSSLTSITIPDGVTSVMPGVFSGCSSLASITTPVVSWLYKNPDEYDDFTAELYPFGALFGTQVYEGSLAIEQYYHRDGWWESGYYKQTYYVPASLKTVTVTADIPEYAFYNCSGLETVAIGPGVKKIGRAAFTGCNLQMVTYCGTAEQWDQISIGSDNTVLENVQLQCHNWKPGCIAERICTVCGLQEGDAPGHNPVITAAVDPSCTGTGLTEGEHCNRCGEVFLAQEVIPALGHQKVTDNAVAVTCTANGLTEGSHCSRCGEVLVAQESIPALGHSSSYIDNGDGTHDYACSRCGVAEIDDAPHSYTNRLCICGKKEILDIQGVSRAKNLSLKDMIYMKASVAFLDSTGNHAKLTKSEILENGRILFWSEKDLPEGSLTAGNATVAQTLADGGVYDDGIQEYYAYSHGVAPAEYGDMIYYRTYIVVDGMEYYGDINEYSVLTYANNQISKTSAKASLKKLLAAMLNYGAAAQVQFQYKADDLVNAGLQSWVDQGKLDASCLAMNWDAGLLTIPDPVDETLMQNFVQKDAQRMTRSLTLQSMVQLKMTFAHKLVDGKGSKLPADASVSFYYWSSEKYNELYDEERALTKGNATYVLTGDAIQESYSSKNGYVYYAYFEGIPAKRLGEALYIAAVFTMADGTEYCSGVEIYSPEVYTNNQLAKDTIAENQKTLLKWMVIYGEEAKNYYAD